MLKKQVLTDDSDNEIQSYEWSDAEVYRETALNRLEWCEEGELNPYALSGTSPSN